MVDIAFMARPTAPVTSSSDAATGRQQQPPQPAVHEAAQPFRRVEEVERVARRRGVDDDEVPLVLGEQADPASPSPCTPACRRATWRRSDRTGCPESLAPVRSGVLDRPSRRTCGACRASSRAARRVTSGASGTRCGVLPRSLMPSAWASRLAGSMVSTTTVRPYSAARSAIAAAVVVLPTPPAPQHTTTRLEVSVRIERHVEGGGVVLIGPPVVVRASDACGRASASS